MKTITIITMLTAVAITVCTLYYVRTQAYIRATETLLQTIESNADYMDVIQETDAYSEYYEAYSAIFNNL